MVAGCGAKVLKYCLFAFNLVFFIAGIVCLGVGIWLIVDRQAISSLIEATEADEKAKADLSDLASRPKVVKDVGVILAIGGAIVILIAFLGCCGAVKEWRPLLIAYAVCLMLILAVEISAAIYAAIKRKTLEEDVQKFMQGTIKFYGYQVDDDGKIADDPPKPNSVMAAWDKIISDNKCCGVWGNQTDWENSKWGKMEENKGKLPKGCCPDSNGDCTETNNKRYTEGCYKKLEGFMTGQLAVVIGVAAGVAVIQLIGIIFSFCLCRAISEEYEMA